ncbi:MAG: hypothetical protein KF889_01565 [Alphaproteobacteria bacterium]|nr:hypothetical protein [Alphaproteobacteria bacterium]MCW5741593.1 hypothetical protein [Alphaproteobacteria bacterium]
MELKYTEPEAVRNTPPQRLETLWGLFPTTSSAPTHVPRNLYEQIVVYRNGATLRLYIYDTANNAWRYATLT